MSESDQATAIASESSPACESISDRRAHRRFPTLLPATVETSRSVLTLVTVLDLSGGGALLRFPLGIDIPDAFQLAVSTGGESALLRCTETAREDTWTGTLVHVRFEELAATDSAFITSVLAALRPEFDEYQRFLVARSNG